MSYGRDTLSWGRQVWGPCSSLYTETAPVHIQGMEWSPGGPAGCLETFGALGLCLQGAVCQSTLWMNRKSQNVCLYMYSCEHVWQTGTCAAAHMQCTCPKWCGLVVWPLEAGGAAGCDHLQHFPQFQCDATTLPLLWSPRHQSRSLAGQIFMEDPECSEGWVTDITVRGHKVWVSGLIVLRLVLENSFIYDNFANTWSWVITWLVDGAGYSQTCTRLVVRSHMTITWTKAYVVHQANLRGSGNESFWVPLNIPLCLPYTLRKKNHGMKYHQ